MAHYSIEPRNICLWKDTDFCLLLKILVKMKVKTCCKYSQKLPEHGKQSAADAIKTISKKVIQEITEATVDSIGNKIANKIRTNLPLYNSETFLQAEEKSIGIPMERYISPVKKQQIIDDLRLM